MYRLAYKQKGALARTMSLIIFACTLENDKFELKTHFRKLKLYFDANLDIQTLPRLCATLCSSVAPLAAFYLLLFRF